MMRKGCVWVWLMLMLLGVQGCTYQASVTGGGAGVSKRLVFKDTVYEEIVGSVRCYADRASDQVLSPPVRALTEDVALWLEFDVLEPQPLPLSFYLVVCQADWQPTQRIDRFVGGLNQYPITDVVAATATREPYMHYRARLPQVLLAGNYLVVVHRLGARSDVLLTARMMVYDGRVRVFDAQATLPVARNKGLKTHRLRFSLDHSALAGIYGRQDLVVYVGQNRNPLQLRRGLLPTQADPPSTLHYRSVFGESDFCAPPSFRRLDLRRLGFEGRGISNWKRRPTDGGWQAELSIDRPRRYHSPELDFNGAFLQEDLHAGFRNSGSYVHVRFWLALPKVSEAPIYILGGFNRWSRQASVRMRYDSASSLYTATLLLRQGYYEYLYWSEPEGFAPVEGCWSRSENEYEIMVYYRDRSSGREPMVGYARFSGQP